MSKKKQYYPVGTIQIVYYNKHDEVVEKESWTTGLATARSHANEHITLNKKIKSAKTMNVTWDSKYSAWSPKGEGHENR